MNGYASIQMTLYLLFFLCGVLMICTGCRLGWKYMVQKKRCSQKTDGIVVGYTKKIRGGEGSHVRLPIVEYTVDGVQYRTEGPEYRAYIIKTSSTSAKKGAEHTYTTDVYRQTFKETIRRSGFLDVVGNPMESLFPQGSLVPVYYDPDKPKLSYVLRYCNCRYIFWLPVLSGILVLAAEVLLIVF